MHALVRKAIIPSRAEGITEMLSHLLKGICRRSRPPTNLLCTKGLLSRRDYRSSFLNLLTYRIRTHLHLIQLAIFNPVVVYIVHTLYVLLVVLVLCL